MIWSVSTLARFSGATSPVCLRNGCMSALELPLADIHKMSGNRGRRSHRGADQVGAPALTLPSFEVTIAGRGTALAISEDVRVHAQTHRASRLAPLEAGVAV